MRCCDSVNGGCADRGIPSNLCEMSGRGTPGRAVPSWLMFGVPALSAAWAGVTTVQDCPVAIGGGIAGCCASALVAISSRHAGVQLVHLRISLNTRAASHDIG